MCARVLYITTILITQPSIKKFNLIINYIIKILFPDCLVYKAIFTTYTVQLQRPNSTFIIPPTCTSASHTDLDSSLQLPSQPEHDTSTSVPSTHVQDQSHDDSDTSPTPLQQLQK